MKRAPTVHEETEERPTLAEAKIILWDELYGAIKDIAAGKKREVHPMILGHQTTARLQGTHRKEVMEKKH